MVRNALVSLFGLLVALPGWAIADVDSGPAVGSEIAPLKVRVIDNGKAAEARDLVPDHAEHPTVYVFLSAERFDRPAARYLREVDAAVQKLQRRDPLAGLVVVWLSEDTDGAAERVTRIQGSLRLLASTWTVFPGPVAGPDGWAVNERAVVTTVLANGREVSARFGYDSVNETHLPSLTAAIDKLTK